MNHISDYTDGFWCFREKAFRYHPIILNKQRFNRKQTPGCVRPSTSPSFLLGTKSVRRPAQKSFGNREKVPGQCEIGSRNSCRIQCAL